MKLLHFSGILAIRSCWQGKQHSKTKQTNLDSASLLDVATSPRQQHSVLICCAGLTDLWVLPNRCLDSEAQIQSGANSEVSCYFFYSWKERIKLRWRFCFLNLYLRNFLIVIIPGNCSNFLSSIFTKPSHFTHCSSI